MKLDNVDMEKLLGIIKAAAVEVLGGEVGNDQSSWVDDIVQDSMIALLEYEDDVADIYNLGSVIAFRRAVNFKQQEERRRKIERENGGDINRALTDQSADALAADPYGEVTLQDALDRLCALSPLLYRTTRAHYIEGHSVAKIAAHEAISENTVYQRLARARNLVSNDNKEQ